MREETMNFLRKCSLEDLSEIANYILMRDDFSLSLASDKRGIMFTVPNAEMSRFCGLNGLIIDCYIDIDQAEVCSLSHAINGDDCDFHQIKLNSFAVPKVAAPAKAKAAKATKAKAVKKKGKKA